jgi:chemotaxis-related protein WspD
MSTGRAAQCWKTNGIEGDRSCPGLAVRIHCRNCPEYSAAAKVLLDREIPDPHRAAWTSLVSVPKVTAKEDRVSIVIFRIGAEWLGIPVELVREITPLHKIHSLPHRSGRGLLGIVNIRGELQLCVSLQSLFELNAREGSGPEPRVVPRMIILEKGRDRWVCPADEVQGICRVRPGDIGNLPVTIGRSAVRFTRGVLSWEDRSVGMVDGELLVCGLKRVTGAMAPT